jgi:hypothetical protein
MPGNNPEDHKMTGSNPGDRPAPATGKFPENARHPAK